MKMNTQNKDNFNYRLYVYGLYIGNIEINPEEVKKIEKNEGYRLICTDKTA